MSQSNGAYAIFIDRIRQTTGNRATMLKEARALGRPKNSGSVTVWQLDTEGLRIGKPIWKSINGKIKIKP